MDHSHNATVSEYSCRVHTLREAAQSENTRMAYEKGWQCFIAWCATVNLVPQEANSEDIAKFLVTMASERRSSGRKPLALNTLRLYRSGLNDRWRRMGAPSPASTKIVDEVLCGLARIRPDRPRRVKALRADQLLAILDSCDQGLHGLRDAALLALGFAPATFRPNPTWDISCDAVGDPRRCLVHGIPRQMGIAHRGLEMGCGRAACRSRAGSCRAPAHEAKGAGSRESAHPRASPACARDTTGGR